MQIIINGFVSMDKIQKNFCLKVLSEASENNLHKDKRIMCWSPFMNVVYLSIYIYFFSFFFLQSDRSTELLLLWGA